LVFSIIGTIGEPYLVRAGDRFGISSSVAIVRPDRRLIDPRFLFYWCKGPLFQKALLGIKGGVAQGYVSLEMIRSLPAPAMPVPLQRRIADIMSAYDDLIENNARRIAILEEMARRIFEEWFVHFRAPGCEGLPMVDSAIGPVPRGWKVAPLRAFGTIVTGKTPSKARPDYFGGEVPFLKLPDMHSKMFCISTSETLSPAGAASQAGKTVPPNSLCVSCIGTAGVVNITSENCQTNQQINTVVLDKLRDREFLFFTLRRLREKIEKFGASGATMTNLSLGKFSSLEVCCPPAERRVAFHIAAMPVFDLILNLQRQSQNLRAQRDLLLPKLISGEIDICATSTSVKEAAE
jgi:type I restriction enzyme S subunit